MSSNILMSFGRAGNRSSLFHRAKPTHDEKTIESMRFKDMSKNDPPGKGMKMMIKSLAVLTVAATASGAIRLADMDSVINRDSFSASDGANVKTYGGYYNQMSSASIQQDAVQVELTDTSKHGGFGQKGISNPGSIGVLAFEAERTSGKSPLRKGIKA